MISGRVEYLKSLIEKYGDVTLKEVIKKESK